jgi:murein DD-endopeptidase MepM/ murein hydrolase activator NlpD
LSKRLIVVVVLFAISFFAPFEFVKAQEEEPTGPIYVVQAGDTLWDIAIRFGVSVNELVQANQLADAGSIRPGDELIIPGLPGITGRLETHTLGLGETLTSLSRDFHTSQELLIQLNRLLSPAELYVGRDIIIPVQPLEASLGQSAWQRVVLNEGQSVLELSVLNGINPWNLALGSGSAGTAALLPGDILRNGGAPAQDGKTSAGSLLPQIEDASLNPRYLVQGKTAVIRLSAPADWHFQGFLGENPLHFFHISEEGVWVALQGVHAMADPGLYPLILQAAVPNGSDWSLTQRVRVIEGSYFFDPNLDVDPATIDPVVTQPENSQWQALTAPVTPQKLWDGLFVSPVDREWSECWTSMYGNRRSYNNSGYLYFHTGLDFCGGVGNAIYTPAAGEVVFQGPFTVRGGATIINHGWGVYTAYMHQSEILVQVGEKVTSGQLIGRVGSTGRVSGPHLHLEVWVGGVQVDPMEWLQRAFP